MGNGHVRGILYNNISLVYQNLKPSHVGIQHSHHLLRDLPFYQPVRQIVDPQISQRLGEAGVPSTPKDPESSS